MVEGVYVREEGRNWRRCDGGHVRVRECVVETVSLDTHTHTQRERERERFSSFYTDHYIPTFCEEYSTVCEAA